MAIRAMQKAIVGIWCDACEMWLNGLDQSDDHAAGKKHRNNTRAGGATKRRQARKARSITDTKFGSNAIIVPSGTCLILEQMALIIDANQMYMLSLYEKAALRSRL